MPLWRTYYHIVWATKKRANLIVPEIESWLHTYLVKKADELEVRVYAINGTTDHIHLVVSIPPKHAVAYVVKCLKGASTHEVNQAAIADGHFEWQRGYGVFTLGEKQRTQAEEYVRRQKEHHHAQTINAWLERVEEFDEGPPDKGIDASTLVVSAVKEEKAIYILAPLDDFPF